MKKLVRPIIASTGNGLTFQDKAVFTPTDVVALLSEIEELEKSPIGLAPDDEGNLLLIVGDNQYVMTDKTTMVFV